MIASLQRAESITRTLKRQGPYRKEPVLIRLSLLLLLSLALFADPALAQSAGDFMARADSLYEAGAYRESGLSYEAAFAIRAGSANEFYNAACSWSLAAEANNAYAMLDGAVARGYREADWIVQDPDLAPLHDDPRWEQTLAAVRANQEAYMASINVELYEMFQADQADRRGDIDWTEVGARDEARRARTREMIEVGVLSTRDDFIHAAFIFQHGGDSTSYALANKLALKAVALDSTSTRARWIAAAARDRYLHSVGKAQIYGTQYVRVDDLWTMDPYDITAVTDEERARWGVPPLARQREREREMNQR